MFSKWQILLLISAIIIIVTFTVLSCDYCVNQIVTFTWKFFRFKVLLPLLLFLATLLLLEIIRPQSVVIYYQYINWYKAGPTETSNINFFFFPNSRISTECQFYDIVPLPFQLGGIMSLLSGQWYINQSFDVGPLARLFLRSWSSWEGSPFPCSSLLLGMTLPWQGLQQPS